MRGQTNRRLLLTYLGRCPASELALCARERVEQGNVVAVPFHLDYSQAETVPQGLSGLVCSPHRVENTEGRFHRLRSCFGRLEQRFLEKKEVQVAFEWGWLRLPERFATRGRAP